MCNSIFYFINHFILENSLFSNGRCENDFLEKGCLGHGGFGVVVKVINQFDQALYALKKIFISASERRLKESLFEVYVASSLNHPNVVRYYSAWIENVTNAPVDDLNSSEYSDCSDDQSSFGSCEDNSMVCIDLFHFMGKSLHVSIGMHLYPNGTL